MTKLWTLSFVWPYKIYQLTVQGRSIPQTVKIKMLSCSLGVPLHLYCVGAPTHLHLAIGPMYFLYNITHLHSVIIMRSTEGNCTIQLTLALPGVLTFVTVIVLHGTLVIPIALFCCLACKYRTTEQHSAKHSSCWDSLLYIP